nr:putative flavin dependent halogenase [Lachnum palmae]
MEPQIPNKTTVLVIGGGPAGSYAAAALAREGVDTVLLEADKFPRYHVGETTNFIAAGGPKAYSYNVVRSEADEIIFRHAGSVGAKIFDGVKVNTIEFVPSGLPPSTDSEVAIPDPGRPSSASWSTKSGASGSISFDYLVDASGRQGLMSTKYLKNRIMNPGEQLQSIANWGYWTNGGTYGVGTEQEGYPYFECISDGSGWVWYIPLHNGEISVGVVRHQKVLTAKKKDTGMDSKEIYLETLKTNPGMAELLKDAKFLGEIKTASDWSYSAGAYASPYVRLAGDAASFIDPFFSSGVHLALNGGLSAAMTICAAIKGQVSELTAATWHSKKVHASYTRFLIVVSSALKQILDGDAAVISGDDEANFDRAFDHFRPVIQGAVDAKAGLSQTEVLRTINFCMGALANNDTNPEKEALMQKLRSLTASGEGGISDEEYKAAMEKVETTLTPGQLEYLNSIRKHDGFIKYDVINLDATGFDVIDGLAPNLVRGELGLLQQQKKISS